MTHSRKVSLGRSALQLATLFVAAAPFGFGGEQPVASPVDGQLMGQMVVTAARPASAIAHLGAMTVTARRDAVFAQNVTPRAAQASL